MNQQDPANLWISGVSVLPQTVTADTNGTGVDFQEGGPEVHIFAASTTIESEEDTKLVIELEESDDNSTFTDMTTDGSTSFAATAISASGNLRVATGYRRTKRYVRAVVNVTGTSVSETVSVILASRKKSL
jgi:hypothetical protein